MSNAAVCVIFYYLFPIHIYYKISIKLVFNTIAQNYFSISERTKSTYPYRFEKKSTYPRTSVSTPTLHHLLTTTLFSLSILLLCLPILYHHCRGFRAPPARFAPPYFNFDTAVLAYSRCTVLWSREDAVFVSQLLAHLIRSLIKSNHTIAHLSPYVCLPFFLLSCHNHSLFFQSFIARGQRKGHLFKIVDLFFISYCTRVIYFQLVLSLAKDLSSPNSCVFVVFNLLGLHLLK